ncbi:hypothetical protein F2Q70_00010824 [Brassica cretica]|uniref:Uncharacterized protein n=2 Tax=Brassica cretica TaxID=69181 RepID=A0A3N6RT65_BRACR|nr:hypothetical protein F2Q68_00003924 [Brassica cretica]KAF2613313.1 hypothetical protein F2Q70_00010824 [Brassica cretica]KAF3550748.1 hypothetical protein DY000_02005808 [Brassica cretica]
MAVTKCRVKSRDFVRAQILSRKINSSVLNADITKQKKKPKEVENIVEEAPADIPTLLELKRIYYELMFRYYSHNNEICHSYNIMPLQLRKPRSRFRF